MENSSQKKPDQRSSQEKPRKQDVKKSFPESGISFILKSFIIFFIIFILRYYILSLLIYLIIIAPMFAFSFLWFKSIQTGDSIITVIKDYITFIPFTYTEKEWKYDKSIWITYVIILANILIHYGLWFFSWQVWIDIIESFMFLPVIEGLFNYLLSPLFSMFLHGSQAHLWSNMFFLWIFGLVVERRIGWKRFIFLYLATGIFASLLSVVFYDIFLNRPFHGIGASGALSGIMGVFMVRLYYKRMVFPIPILGLFSLFIPIGLKIRINSMIVIGFYFVLDFTAGIQQIHGNLSHIAYWAHIFGMISGILLALLLKLQEDAFEEMHTERGVQALEEHKLFVNGEKSLRIVLEKNPENETALLALARERTRREPTEEGYDLYHRLISVVVKSDPGRAAEIFVEYFRVYWRNIEPNLQYRLAAILCRKRDYDTSTRAMEMLVDDEKVQKEVREKALFQLALTLESIKFLEVAMYRYEQFILQFPDSTHIETAKKKLEALKAH